MKCIQLGSLTLALSISLSSLAQSEIIGKDILTAIEIEKGRLVPLKIDEHYAKRDVKLMFHITMQERLNKEELKLLFEGLRAKNKKPYDYYDSVFFKILVDGGVYAHGDYSGKKREVRIQGKSQEEIDALSVLPVVGNGSKLVGAWVDRGNGTRIHLAERGGNTYLAYSWSAETKDFNESKVTFSKKNTEFIDTDGEGKYVIAEDGTLSLIIEGQAFFVAYPIKDE